LFPATGRAKISQLDFAAMWIGHLDAIAQSGVQLPQLGPPRFPSFFVLAKFRIGQIRSLKEQTASLVFDSPIEHFLQ
jgi:hypothetical protein